MSMPTARLTDMHVCPMLTGPVPHVGGPVISPGLPPGLFSVMPSARVGDICVCVGPPDSIVKGSATTLVGSMPVARVGDTTAHGGTIVGMTPTILIGG